MTTPNNQSEEYLNVALLHYVEFGLGPNEIQHLHTALKNGDDLNNPRQLANDMLNAKLPSNLSVIADEKGAPEEVYAAAKTIFRMEWEIVQMLQEKTPEQRFDFLTTAGVITNTAHKTTASTMISDVIDKAKMAEHTGSGNQFEITPSHTYRCLCSDQEAWLKEVINKQIDDLQSIQFNDALSGKEKDLNLLKQLLGTDIDTKIELPVKTIHFGALNPAEHLEGTAKNSDNAAKLAQIINELPTHQSEAVLGHILQVATAAPTQAADMQPG